MVTRDDLPPYHDLILPTLRAVATLGGSAQARELAKQVSSDLGATDEMLALTYDGRDKSVLLDRISWAMSYAHLGGLLDRPRRGVYVLSTAGRDVLAMSSDTAYETVRDIDREVRGNRRRAKAEDAPTVDETNASGAGDQGEALDGDDDADAGGSPGWREVLLARLHQLTPEGFEEFVMYLLRLYGMELTRVGGSGDEGIDGIGLAPISPVLASRVAVQAKRYEPGKVHGRDVVALFQRDAGAAGAERAVLVTLARFSPAAEKAATVATPTVNLIDGQKLCDLIEEQGVGLQQVTQVVASFFDRFDKVADPGVRGL